jgi:hypothetical protein
MLVQFQPRQPAFAWRYGSAGQFPPGGEIESRLAYTRKSEGQNLPGRLAFASRLRRSKPATNKEQTPRMT